jgi:hypothetical protein
MYVVSNISIECASSILNVDPEDEGSVLLENVGTCQSKYSVTSYKVVIFMITTMKISDLL